MNTKKIVAALLLSSSLASAVSASAAYSAMAQYKKHRILTSLCLLTMLALLVGCTNTPSSTPGTICGTYTSGEAEFQKILAVDQNHQVYYADQKNDCFILGEVRQQKGDSYLISCQSSNYGDRIPDQEFTYDGKGFAITIQGERFEFEKIDDIPSVIGDVARYS